MDAHDERTHPRSGQRGPEAQDGTQDVSPPPGSPHRTTAADESRTDDEAAEAEAAETAEAETAEAEAPDAKTVNADTPEAETADARAEADAEAAEAGSPAVPGPSAEPGPSAVPGARPATDPPLTEAPQAATPASEDAPVSAPGPAGARTGIGALPLRHQVVAAVALAVIMVVTCVHLALVFLSVAPSNTMTKQHGQVVDDWVLPEFEQNWKLFAPNPLQQNIAVEARAEVRTASGTNRTTQWFNISALDGAAIDHNLLPSHTQQNELRRAWDFFTATHDEKNRPTGMRGQLSENYLRHIIVMRMHRLGVGVPAPAPGAASSESAEPTGSDSTKDTVVRIQVRSRTTNVQRPFWSGTGPYGTKPVFRTLAWWSVTPDDLPLDAAAAPERTRSTTTEASAR